MIMTRTAAIRWDEYRQALCFVALLAVVSALSTLGAGSAARLLYMGTALLWAAVTRRRSPWLFVTGTLWFWLFTSFARRIIEWRTGFQNGDIILITPNMMALFMLPTLLTTPGLLRKRNIGYPLLIAACVMYGVCVSLFRGELLAAAASATDWVTPVIYLLYFVCCAEGSGELETHFTVFLPLTLLLVLPYAIYQWYLMPPWDAQWMIGSGFGAIGNPLPMGSRIFGSMNNPLFLSLWCATCLVLTSHFRSVLGLVLAPVAMFVVALAEVRCVYGSIVLAFAVGAFAGRGGFGRLLVIVCVSLVTLNIGASIVSPKVTDQIYARFSTLGDLSHDGSATMRMEALAAAPALLEANPLGMGIGAQGRGAGAGSNDPTLALNIDNGMLSAYLALGWIPGTLYMVGLGGAFLQALRIGRRARTPAASAMAAASICAIATFPFINTLGFTSVVMWCCIGFALAQDEVDTVPDGRQAGPARLQGLAA